MSKKIVFMGTPEFAVKTLEVIVKSKYKLECVYTQPPKKSSRGQKLKALPVETFAEQLKLNIRTPKSLNDNIEYEYFKSIKPYIVIVVAYGQIIPARYLSLAEKGFINIHASILPKWRGAAPIQRSIMNQDKETGISFMKIEEGLDTGPFLKQIKVDINENTTFQELNDVLAKLGAKNILDCIKTIEQNKANFTKQDENKVSYAKKINKLESKILWNQKAETILAKINGLNPSPGAWFEYKGIRHKVLKAEISNFSGEPGKVLNKNLLIGCKEKSISVKEIQKEGKKKLATKEFLIGSKINKGDLLS
jgi:methionyl-tRNA formyltransferase